MEISILVEQIEKNGYRATALVPSPMTTEGKSREEALEQMRTLLQGRLASAELVRFEVPLAGERNPWLAVAGSLRNHPDADEVRQNMEEYRRAVDADPNRL